MLPWIRGPRSFFWQGTSFEDERAYDPLFIAHFCLRLAKTEAATFPFREFIVWRAALAASLSTTQDSDLLGMLVMCLTMDCELVRAVAYEALSHVYQLLQAAQFFGDVQVPA